MIVLENHRNLNCIMTGRPLRTLPLLLVMVMVMMMVLTTCVSAQAGDEDERNHKKRQIYREQVLPHAGGRIPETAFETDRLFLNRLQKEGIAIPDGIALEQRNPQVYPYTSKSARNVFRIALSSDGRYTPDAGKYHHRSVPSIDTTYLYPPVYGQKTRAPQPRPSFPVYRQLQLHSNQLNQLRFQPKSKGNAAASPSTPQTLQRASKLYKSESYQNFNILNAPNGGSAVLPLVVTKPRPTGGAGKFYLPNYGKSNIFSEFDELFGNFDLPPHSPEPDFYGKMSSNTHPRRYSHTY